MKPLDERRIMVKKEMNLSQVWAIDITYIPMKKRFYVFDRDHRFAHEIYCKLVNIQFYDGKLVRRSFGRSN
jgi:hypothetical protein